MPSFWRSGTTSHVDRLKNLSTSATNRRFEQHTVGDPVEECVRTLGMNVGNGVPSQIVIVAWGMKMNMGVQILRSRKQKLLMNSFVCCDSGFTA